MKKSRKKTIYITVLRYIFRGTLFSSIFISLSTVHNYDPNYDSFLTTIVKIIILGVFILLSVRGLSQIDLYFSRRFDKLKLYEVANMATSKCKPCVNCAYRKDKICGQKCEEGVKEWLKERL